MPIDAAANPPLPAGDFDNPWRRLPWTLPAGIVAWALLLGIVGHLINEPVVRPMQPPPVEAQLVEEPPPAPPTAPEPPAPKAVPKAQTRAPTPRQAPVTTAPPVATPTAPAALPSAPSAPPMPPAPAAAPVEKTATGPAPSAASGARIISRPMPVIPDDLRDEAFNAAALARFTIAADGSATVELVKPTQNPRLNRLLLDSLKNWRFFPAIREGKPVASTQEIVVRFQVK